MECSARLKLTNEKYFAIFSFVSYILFCDCLIVLENDTNSWIRIRKMQIHLQRMDAFSRTRHNSVLHRNGYIFASISLSHSFLCAAQLTLNSFVTLINPWNIYLVCSSVHISIICRFLPFRHRNNPILRALK